MTRRRRFRLWLVHWLTWWVVLPLMPPESHMVLKKDWTGDEETDP